MNLINRIKVGWKNEEFSKIRKYIRKPAYITFAIAGSIMTLAIIFLFAIGKLEDIIVSMDIRYNSPIFFSHFRSVCIKYSCYPYIYIIFSNIVIN